MFFKTNIILKLTLLLVTLILRQHVSAQDTVNIQLKWRHQFQFAGYYAALKNNYFKELGLKVKLIEGGSNTDIVDKVVTGQVQYAVSSSEIITDFIAGKPLCVIAVIFQHSPYILLSSTKSNIKRPTDLVGKKIMATSKQGWTEIKAVFLKEGIDPTLLKLKEHVWDLNYLANGKADALSGYISFEPYMLDKMGISYNIIKPEDYGVDFYGDLLFSTQDYVKNNNTQVDNIKSAIIKGWEYAFAHQEEMADYILALPGVINRGVTKDILLKEAAAIYKLAEPDLISIGHMNHGRWQTILNTHKQLGLSPQNITLDGFIYTQIPVEYKGKFRLVFYISLALLVCIIFVLSYNYLLKKEVREQTNALRKTTEELLLSNAELEKFAYVASHNLRAPVVNIISLMQLYDRNNPSSPDNDYIITKLNDTTKNLSNTLKDLIHVVSSNDVNNDLQSLNIEQVFNEVKESISELIVETNTLITCKFATTEVYYSHKALSSILLNLITNSIKYRKPNSPAVIELLTITKKDGIEIQVKDNGIGIDLDKYGEKLFGLFQRFNTNIEGSGIGLHIIKKQIETLGGKISVNSAVNIGTTVTVNIKRNL